MTTREHYTTALKLVDAARALGFIKTRKQNLTFEYLKVEFERGLYPITFIEVQLASGQPFQKHAIVIVAISEDNLFALDPARGEVSYSIDEFILEWNRTRRLTILIEK